MRQPNTTRTVTWRRIRDFECIEEATFAYADLGYRFAGTVLGAESGLPLRVNYEVVWDENWGVQQCEIAQTCGGVHRSCSIRATDQQWFINGDHDAALDGCVDLDLGISPSTNTSAINRMALRVGQTQAVSVAYVSFPDLAVIRAQQSYERLSLQRYIYQNIDSGFTAALDVDSDGLTLLYHGVWDRLAEA
jgi:hypothetical protein